MSEESQQGEDLTGRSRFGWNVAFAWGGYLVNVVSGFIVPRLISDQMGQVTLGIWDFSWSVIAYFGLVQLGLGGSIARYVSRHRACDDVDALNRSVSTIALFQRLAGVLAIGVTFLVTWWILPLFSGRFGEQLETAQWVVLFLGLEIGLSICLAVYGAVIVGCHRWDIHNSVSAAAYGLTAAGMIIVLLCGGGLPMIALVHASVMISSELVRRRMLKTVCPELEIKRQNASWVSFLEQARYSIKSLAPRVANLVSDQTLSIMVTAFLGPASLAIFSRPRSLVHMFRTLAAKYGAILVPTSSSLQVRNNDSELREVVLTAPAGLSVMLLPPMLTLGLLGDFLIRLWMGEPYVLTGLVSILVVGAFASAVQEPIWSVLAGMNSHGRLSVVRLGAAIVSAVVLAIGLAFFGWGLTETALMYVLPQVIVDGFVSSIICCRHIGVSIVSYFRITFLKPLGCVLPYGIGLVVAVAFHETMPGWAVVALASGVLLSGLLYWFQIFSEGWRRRILSGFGRLIPFGG